MSELDVAPRVATVRPQGRSDIAIDIFRYQFGPVGQIAEFQSDLHKPFTIESRDFVYPFTIEGEKSVCHLLSQTTVFSVESEGRFWKKDKSLALARAVPMANVLVTGDRLLFLYPVSASRQDSSDYIVAAAAVERSGLNFHDVEASLYVGVSILRSAIRDVEAESDAVLVDLGESLFLYFTTIALDESIFGEPEIPSEFDPDSDSIVKLRSKIDAAALGSVCLAWSAGRTQSWF